MEATTVPTTLLMLDDPRVIAIKDGKFTYTFHFSRITQADWDKYFAGIYVASRSESNAQINTTDVQTSAIDLFESKLVKAEGYKREMTTKDDFWKVPLRHSNQVSWLLRLVVPSAAADDDSPLDADLIEARIDALWSQTEPGTETTLFKGLVHRFSPPSAEQKKRFLRSGAISRIVGGSRNATTIYASRNRVMMELYDQLIHTVDGYGVAGKALETVEQIRREMDGYHKAEAVAQLFTTVEAPAQATEATAA